MSHVVRYYEGIDEDTRFSRNSRRIEFLTTIHALERILPPQAKILDVGAGTGAYTFHYAERKHEVVAVDLTPKHIDQINQKRDQSGLPIEAHVADATDLTQFSSGTFDAVLCFGPLYHLTEQTDRSRCISECLRVLKQGGILAVAYINKYSVIPMLVTRDKTFIRNSVIEKVIDTGVITEGNDDCFWTDACFTSPAEVESMLAPFDVAAMDHVGTDGISHTIHEYVDRLSDEEFESWMSYHLQTCRERSILGMSTHGLYICSKN